MLRMPSVLNCRKVWVLFVSGEDDEDCGEGGGDGRLSLRGDDAPRLGAASVDEAISVVGTVFLFAGQAGHQPSGNSLGCICMNSSRQVYFVSC